MEPSNSAPLHHTCHDLSRFRLLSIEPNIAKAEVGPQNLSISSFSSFSSFTIAQNTIKIIQTKITTNPAIQNRKNETHLRSNSCQNTHLSLPIRFRTCEYRCWNKICAFICPSSVICGIHVHAIQLSPLLTYQPYIFNWCYLPYLLPQEFSHKKPHANI